MAYYGSAYSGSDYGEYNFNSYAVNYDYSQIPSFMTYSGYDTYNQPYYGYGYGYDTSSYYAPNCHAQSHQTVSYSATTFSDPKSVVYDPNYGMSQLVISYSNLEFNQPEFDEYDPTPYGGGYDIAQTYGKPLPPSDKICYPRSASSPNTSVPFDPVPAGSIVPLPTTVEEGIDEKPIKPQNETEVLTKEDKPQSQDSNKEQPREVEDNNYDTSDEGEESEENNYGSGFGERYSGGQGEENEKQVAPQYPSGYGLEAMDLCESLFGYWPCLARMNREHKHCFEEASHRGNYCQENMWKGTADYLFGNPNPYGGGSGYGGDLVYGYERHDPSQAQYKQVDYYADESW